MVGSGWWRSGAATAMWRLFVFMVLVLAGTLIALVAVTSIVGPDAPLPLRLVALHGSLVVAVLVASAIMTRRFERRPLAAVGVAVDRSAGSELGRGLALGAAALAALAALQFAAGWLRPAPDDGTAADLAVMLAGVLVVLAVAAAAEELLFRGYAFQVLVRALGPVPAVALSSVIFGAVHADNPAAAPLALVNITLAGALLAVAYLRTRRLWAPIGLHWGWNGVMAGLDLPVSGLGFDLPAYDLRSVGPDPLTGGEFGPEGGLLATVVLIGAIVWAARTSWFRPSPRMLEMETVADRRAPGDGGPA